MDGLNRKRVLTNRLKTLANAALITGAVACMAAAANAQSDRSKQREQAQVSALEQYRDMSDSERAELASEAAAKSAIANRSATPSERTMLMQSPASARAQLKTDSVSLSKRTGSAVGKEIRAGNSVGKVLGTAYFNSRTIDIKHGKHLEACEVEKSANNPLHDHTAAADIAPSALNNTDKGAIRE